MNLQEKHLDVIIDCGMDYDTEKEVVERNTQITKDYMTWFAEWVFFNCY